MTRTEESWFAIRRIMLSALCLAPLAVLLGITTHSEARAGKHKPSDTGAVRSNCRPIFEARDYYDE